MRVRSRTSRKKRAASKAEIALAVKELEAAQEMLYQQFCETNFVVANLLRNKPCRATRKRLLAILQTKRQLSAASRSRITAMNESFAGQIEKLEARIAALEKASAPAEWKAGDELMGR